jgi:hypothetical protein
LQWILEESSRYEGAPNTTPTRLSTNVLFMPIQTAQPDPGVQQLDRSDEVRGINGAVANLIDSYEPAGNITVRAYPNLLPYILPAAGLVGTATPGAASGVLDPDGGTIPVGCTRWVYAKRTGIAAKTAQIQFCYPTVATFMRMQGVGVNQLTFNAAGALGLDLTGLVFARMADPNLTPVLEASALPPFRRGDLSIPTWLASTGQTDDFTVTLTSPVNRRHTFALSPPSYFPDLLEHADDRVQLRGTIPKAVLAAADVDALLAGTTFAAKAKWESPQVIAGGYKYRMWIEMPKVQLSGGTPEPLANRRRFGGSWEWFATWDESAGYDFKITLVDAVPAVDTFV